MAERIARSIGDQEKTDEQLRIALNFPNASLFASAMTKLEREDRVASRIIEALLPTNEAVPLRVWRFEIGETE